MSDLFVSMSVAARALEAQSAGLDVVGQNIANVNTPGYARRTAELAEVPPLDSRSAGNGVTVTAITAARTPFIDARILQEQPTAGREGVIADQLSQLQTVLGQPGSSLDATLSAFYNSFGALSRDPGSVTARQQVLYQAQALCTGFQATSAQFGTAQRSADREIRGDIDQVNALAAQIAQLNGSIIGVDQDTAATFHDQQQVALQALSNLIDVSVQQRGDGGIDLALGNGRALVVGTNTYDLSVTTSGSTGLAQIISSGAATPTDVTSEITGGRIGGLIQLRDVVFPGYQSRLDQLAYSVATDVNALHQGGTDLNGNPGGALFTPPAAVSGAAASLAVNPVLAADPRLVVASSTSAAGNNDVARALAALQDVPMTGTAATPVDAWGDLVYRVGADTQSATAAHKTQTDVLQQLNTMKDQVTGVSLDEEAAAMMRFQRAYEANAKFFSTVAQSLDLLMQMVGG